MMTGMLIDSTASPQGDPEETNVGGQLWRLTRMMQAYGNFRLIDGGGNGGESSTRRRGWESTPWPGGYPYLSYPRLVESNSFSIF
jgi:hypothetical protein